MDFVERLERRNATWWTARARLTDPRTIRRSLHFRRDLAELRSADDPESRWRCCDAWPRKLLHKWNSREYVQRYGCRVPQLFAYAETANDVPFDDLPEQYVIRPVLGFVHVGTHAMTGDLDLISERRFTGTQLRELLAGERGAGRGPFLVEELIECPDGTRPLPYEFKCFTFGAEVAAIELTRRIHGRTGGRTSRYYTADWTPFADPMEDELPLDEGIDPPEFLAEMVETAARLGESIGTFMRIDFFGSTAGPVFNEFSSVPNGNDPKFTPYCRDLFGARWAERFPDAI